MTRECDICSPITRSFCQQYGVCPNSSTDTIDSQVLPGVYADMIRVYGKVVTLPLTNDRLTPETPRGKGKSGGTFTGKRWGKSHPQIEKN